MTCRIDTPIEVEYYQHGDLLRRTVLARDAQTLNLDGTETFDILGLTSALKPQQDLTLRVTRKDGATQEIAVTCRIDTPIEVEYYQHGGILPYVLRQLMATK